MAEKATLGEFSVKLTLDGREMVVGADKARSIMRQLERQMSATGNSVGRIEKHLTSTATKFRHFVMTAGMLRFALKDVNDIFLRLPMSVLKTAGEIERLTKLMEGLSSASTQAGRSAEAIKNMNLIFSMAKSAPFEVKSIADAFVKMKVAGLDPTNGALQALLDSVAKFGGTSQEMHRASVAIQQMGGKGVISMEELRQQLGEAVPTAIKSMALGMGVSMAELVDKISKGMLTAPVGLARMLAAMEAENSGAAARMMTTWGGMVSQLQTRWALFQKDIGDAEFVAAAKDALAEMLAIFDDPAAKVWAKAIGEGLATAVREAHSLAKLLIEYSDAVKRVAISLGILFVAPRIIGMFQGVLAGIRGFVADFTAAEQAKRVQARITAVEQSELIAARIAKEKASLLTLEAIRREHDAKILANQVRLNAAMDSLRAGQTSKGRFISIDGTRREIEGLNNVNRVLAQNIAHTNTRTLAIRKQVAELGLLQRAHLAVAGAAAAHMGALQRVGGWISGTGRFVFAALGGWIGVISLALIFGTWAWSRWADGGKKAIADIRQAVKDGYVSDEQITKANAEVEAQQEKIDKAKKALAPLEDQLRKKREQLAKAEALGASSPVLDRFRREEAALAKQVESYREQITKAEAEKNRAVALVAEGQGVRNATEASAEARRQQQADEKRINEIRARQQTEVAVYEEGALKLKVSAEKINEEKRKIFAKGAEEIIALHDSMRKEAIAAHKALTEEAGPNPTNAQKVMIDAFQERIDRQTVDLNRAREALVAFTTTGTFDGLMKKDDKAAKRDRSKHPLLEMIEEAEGSLEQAKIKLKDLEDGVVDFADVEEGIRAKMMGKARAGDYDERDSTGNRIALMKKEGDLFIFASAKGEEHFNTLVKLNAEIKSHELLLRAQEAATKLAVTAQEEAAEAVRDQNAGYENTRSRLEQVNLALAKQRQLILGQKGDLIEFDREANLARGSAAITDSARSVIDMRKKTLDLLRSANTDERARIAQGYDDELSLALRNQAQIMQGLRETADFRAGNMAQVIAQEKTFSEWLAAHNLARARALMKPVELLVDQWSQVGNNLNDAAKGWAEGFVNTFVDGIRKGKIEWKDFATQVLADLLKIRLQQTAGKAIGGLADILANAAASYFAPTASAGNLAGTSFVSDGMGGRVAALADGGVMTKWGQMELRKYARGGIADAPQMAIYGEGSMNEAFVPLPDGRSIPVTMNGSGPVTVNVINQTGQPVEGEATSRIDGKQMILDIVISGATRPGAFRDTMRGAMR